MKVRITKSGKEGYWYSSHIGECFEVKEYNSLDYETLEGGLIAKIDCEVIPYEPVLIAEQPKEKTAEEIHDELHLILNMNEKDLEEKYKNSPFSHPVFGTIEKLKNNDSERLFQAALAAMQGMLIREKTPYVERLCNDCWDYAEALINEGKKRGKLK